MRTGVLALTASLVLAPVAMGGDGGGAAAGGRTFTLHPIGTVVKEGGRSYIVLDKKYEPGLMGLDGYPEVTVVYWFDRNDTPEGRAILQVHPRGDPQNPLRGVFATRSPFRPNLIAISRCKIVAIRGNVVEVDDIDALPGSPVLDLKN
jgi:tRNA-Thr(GGU) m(6)t(6)A37 methyltransferase TsaA